MGIGAAIAAAGVAASVGTGIMSSQAAKGAAKTQADAANQASQRALDQYNQTRADLSSWRDSGNDSNNALATIINRGDNDAAMRMLEGTPGYAFARDQGLKSIQNSATARGLGVSGAAMKGAGNFVTGLAQQTYVQNLLNPLMQMSKMGLDASTQTGAFGQQSATNASNAAMSGASSTAAGQVGSANAIGGALNQAGASPLNYAAYNQLFGNGTTGGGATGTDATYVNPLTGQNYTSSSNPGLNWDTIK